MNDVFVTPLGVTIPFVTPLGVTIPFVTPLGVITPDYDFFHLHFSSDNDVVHFRFHDGKPPTQKCTSVIETTFFADDRSSIVTHARVHFWREQFLAFPLAKKRANAAFLLAE